MSMGDPEARPRRWRHAVRATASTRHASELRK